MTDPATLDGSTYQTPLRIDQMGRVLCSAHVTRTGQPCNGPAMNGQTTCRMHGGSTMGARRAAMVRLLDLTPDALDALADAVRNAPEFADRIRAANSILDRTGYPRTPRVSKEDAWAMVAARLAERLEVKGNRALGEVPGDE